MLQQKENGPQGPIPWLKSLLRFMLAASSANLLNFSETQLLYSITKLSKILLLFPPVITEVLTRHSRTTAYQYAVSLKSATSPCFPIVSV